MIEVPLDGRRQRNCLHQSQRRRGLLKELGLTGDLFLHLIANVVAFASASPESFACEYGISMTVIPIPCPAASEMGRQRSKNFPRSSFFTVALPEVSTVRSAAEDFLPILLGMYWRRSHIPSVREGWHATRVSAIRDASSPSHDQLLRGRRIHRQIDRLCRQPGGAGQGQHEHFRCVWHCLNLESNYSTRTLRQSKDAQTCNLQRNL